MVGAAEVADSNTPMDDPADGAAEVDGCGAVDGVEADVAATADDACGYQGDACGLRHRPCVSWMDGHPNRTLHEESK